MRPSLRDYKDNDLANARRWCIRQVAGAPPGRGKRLRRVPRALPGATFRSPSEADADAVIICIPNHLHAPVTLAALESGKHVLVEKPMALSLADAAAMVAAAERAGRVLMCGLSLRFASSIRQVKALVSGGAVGT